jgi:hypothetical protein
LSARINLVANIAACPTHIDISTGIVCVGSFRKDKLFSALHAVLLFWDARGRPWKPVAFELLEPASFALGIIFVETRPHINVLARWALKRGIF